MATRIKYDHQKPRDVYHFLDKNENVSPNLYAKVIDTLNNKHEEFENAELWLIESEDKLGLIIDIVDEEDGEVLEEESVTYWYDDYSS